jgi:hypothetical protein
VYLFYNTHNDIENTIVFTEVPGVSDHEYDCVHWSTWSEWSCIRLCSLEYLEWVIMNTIVFTEVPGVSDHVCNCVHWSTWSEWSWIRLCSLKYLEISQWCRLFSPVSSTSETDVHDTTEILLEVVHNPNYNNIFHLITASVNTIVYMITHSRYFSEHNRVHDRSLQVLVHWSTWSEWSCIRLCSLKYLEWAIMYTIVFTEVPGVSSEHNRIHDHSLQVLQWTQTYTWSLTPGTSVNTIVYMIAHSRYFSGHNRIHDRSLHVLQWTQSYTWSLTPGTSMNTIVCIIAHFRYWSTWSERSCIRLCSLKYLKWVIMYTIVFTGVPGVMTLKADQK